MLIHFPPLLGCVPANCKHMQQQWAALEALYTAKRAKAIGATNAFAEPFGILKTDQFTKTGLGQT